MTKAKPSSKQAKPGKTTQTAKASASTSLLGKMNSKVGLYARLVSTALLIYQKQPISIGAAKKAVVAKKTVEKKTVEKEAAQDECQSGSDEVRQSSISAGLLRSHHLERG